MGETMIFALGVTRLEVQPAIGAPEEGSSLPPPARPGVGGAKIEPLACAAPMMWLGRKTADHGRSLLRGVARHEEVD